MKFHYRKRLIPRRASFWTGTNVFLIRSAAPAIGRARSSHARLIVTFLLATAAEPSCPTLFATVASSKLDPLLFPPLITPATIPLCFSLIQLLSPEFRNFLCNINPHRAPRDAPSATHTPGDAKLVLPGRKLVGDPLAIPCPGLLANRSPMHIAVLRGETGIPALPSF